MISANSVANLSDIYKNFEKFVRENKLKCSDDELHGYAYFEEGQFFPLFPVYHLLNGVVEKKGLTPIRYRHERHSRAFDRAKYRVLNRFEIDAGLKWPFRFFKALGIEENVYPKLSGKGFIVGLRILLSRRLVDKGQVLKWEIDGILVGDLFYDWHLRSRKIPTPKINSFYFLVDVLMFCSHFNWWRRQFEKQKPNFIFTSHSCYIQGLVARIGLTQGAKVFNIGDHWFHRLTKDRPLADLEFMDYVPFASNFNGYWHNRERSSNSLIQLLEGVDSTTFAHETVGYQDDDVTKVLSVFPRGSFRPRVLIACHCF